MPTKCKLLGKGLALATCLVGAICSQAAITVQNLNTPGVNDTALANSIADTTTITITGTPVVGVNDNDQAGLFSGGRSAGLLIDAGVILSTGAVSDATQANNVPDDGDVLADISSIWWPPLDDGDSDLDRMIPGNETLDGANMEFAFTPTYSNLKIELVFASEEYNEFVGAFNDVAGVFIKYPGESEWVNVSCPDVISVNSINQNDQSCLFVDNSPTSGSTAPIGLPYDGFTKKLIMRIPVIAGQTHHIKVAIGDVGDEQLDSAVFVKQDSVSSFACGVTPGTLDSSFAPSGANDWVWAVAEQPDGKVILGGQFTTMNGSTRNYLARINADGTLDSSSSWFYLSFDGPVYAIALQPDGKILVGGSFSQVYSGGSWVTRNKMARLNSDGSLDTTFSNPFLNGTVRGIAVLSDGSVVAVGGFVNNSPYSPNYIARYSSTGSMLWAPANVSGADGWVYAVAETFVRESNGALGSRVLIGGAFTTVNGTTRQRVARLNLDGSIDTAFDTSSGANNTVYAIAMQGSRPVLGGAFTSFAATTRNRAARLLSNGSLDPTFDPGTGPNAAVYAINTENCNEIYIGGDFSAVQGTSRNRIAALLPSGKLQTTFNPGTGGSSSVLALDLAATGSLSLGGAFTTYNGTTRNRYARVSLCTAGTAGSLDSTFSPSGANSTVNISVEQPDGKLIVGGAFTTVNGTTRNYLTRLNADGTLDTTGNWYYLSLNGAVQSIALQPDGKVLIGGAFTSIYDQTVSSWVTRNKMARLTTSGSVDTTFGNPFLNGNVRAIVVGSDGYITLGGEFVNNSPYSPNYIARYGPNGGMQWSPGSVSGANGVVYSIVEDANGDLIFGGSFTTMNGSSANRLARINTAATVDGTFSSGTGPNAAVYTMAIQTDGKIVIGGDFTSYAGTTRNRLARISSTGALDTLFNPGSAANSSVLSVLLEGVGNDCQEKIVVAGAFTTFNGVTQNRITRLNEDGTRDVKFVIGTGFNDWVWHISESSNRDIWAAGAFTSFNGTTRNRIARIIGQ